LVSFHLASNDPENLVGLFDNLQEKTSDLGCIEVLVKIDTEDGRMHEVMAQQVVTRPFSIRCISRPCGAGFADLWKAYNELLPLTDGNAYFLCLLSDEVRLNETGWDAKLKLYVGLFPDHIFRLRTTRLKFRNYYDFWECGYAPDSFAFYTKRWLEIVGNWNVCSGPDSSQQFIAYYLGYANYPGFHQYNRDVPILDISFSGEGASAGMNIAQRQLRDTLNFRLWFPLVSHAVQEELFRRARLLQANISLAEFGNIPVEIVEDASKRSILIRNTATGVIYDILSYRISRLKLLLRNLRRTLRYKFYAGGGPESWDAFPFSLLEFLIIYYPRLRGWLAPIIDSKAYWISKEVMRMVTWAIHQRQPRVFVHEVEKFSRSNVDWNVNYPIAYQMTRFLVLVARFLDVSDIHRSPRSSTAPSGDKGR
jgi:hypothetical protein